MVYVLAGDSIQYADGSYSALEGADALAIVTEWNMVKSPDVERIKKLLKNPVIFDGRNLFNPSEMRNHGFVYFGMGRK